MSPHEEAVMTVTEPEALEAMLTHHQALEEGVRARVDAFVAVGGVGGASARAAAELVAYLAGEVLPHAQAEELTVYRSARSHPDLTGAVEEMIREHHAFADTIERLAGSPDSTDARSDAEQLAALFSVHVAKENDIVLPALVADPDVNLGAVLAEMHGLVEAATHDAAKDTSQSNADPLKALVSLLLKAATALAQADRGDQACRLAAAAWAVLRQSRPDLAVRVTAALHGLARQADPAPVTLSPASRPAGDGPVDTELDVRSFAPAQRHQLIFATYEQLVPGTGFILVNDHDPKPLGYQFEAEHSGQYTWDYLEAGPTVWRVRIGRLAASASSQAEAAGEDLPELDVRSLPHARRHEPIFAAYAALAPGTGFALVNDHDPRPLGYQFEAQYPGQYTWDYLEAGPTVWRVRIGRTGR